MIHLREEGQLCEEGAELRTRCGRTKPRNETAWSALEAAGDACVAKVPLDLCRECLDLEITWIIHQIHSLTLHLVGYRDHFWGQKCP